MNDIFILDYFVLFWFFLFTPKYILTNIAYRITSIN